jgi:hypothetical protein
MFLFLAAGAVALFAFLSVAVWVGAQAQERKARDRFALLKSVAENPGENGQKVLDLLRDQEEKETARREREERRAYVVGGLCSLASGVGLSLMFLALTNAKHGIWAVGLIPLFVGIVLTVVGAKMTPGR